MKTQSDESKSRKPHWLYRPENRPKLWAIQLLVLIAAVVPDFFIEHHPHVTGGKFTLDSSFAFFAWYGFITCAGMVAVAKVLGIFLKRKETYYDE